MLLTLPVPPSVNALYGNNQFRSGKGRYKTKRYARWVAQADAHYTFFGLNKATRPAPPYHIRIKLPAIRGDVANREKALTDWLVSRKLIEDDSTRYVWKITTEFDPRLTALCEVSIMPYNPRVDVGGQPSTASTSLGPRRLDSGGGRFFNGRPYRVV